LTQQNSNQRDRNNPRDRNSGGDGDVQEHVVHIRRVSKVVKGGRHLTFNAMVVVGDGNGSVGVGLGKGAAVPDAVRKGTTIAKARMVKVELVNGTVPHQVNAHFGASHVVIKPGQPGSGVKAGGAVRAVMEAVGVKDIVTKALGSRNPINVVKATVAGLQKMQPPKDAVDTDREHKGAVLPPISPERRGPLRREGGGGFRGRDRYRDRRPPRPNDRDRDRPAAPPAGAPPAGAPPAAAPPVSAAPVTPPPAAAPPAPEQG
jgi:small subunit ribosomal protein S5